MDLAPDILKTILLESGYVSDEDFEKVAKEAKGFDKSIVDVLIFKGLITEELLGKLVAKQLGFPYASLRNKIIAPEILEIIPEKIAHTYKLIPFEKKEKELFVEYWEENK